MTPSFIPGPVDVAPEVLAAQARPMLPHRSGDFEALFHRTEEKARKLFSTHNPVYLATCSAPGLQEAAVRNFANERLLACVNGAYSELWYQIALSNGKQVDRLDFDWGEPVVPEVLMSALRDKPYEAVLIVHNENSTGVESPLQELASAALQSSPETLIVVDAVSSLGGRRIEMDEWGIDFILAASEFCLAVPPGLALAAASERALRKAESVANRGWYFDLPLMEKHRQKDSTPMIPAMGLIYALEAQLDRIFAEGLEPRYARHAALAERVQSWAIEHGMPPLASAGARSRTLTVLQNKPAFEVAALNRSLGMAGMQVANGAGRLREKYFCIAHMGEIQLNELETLLEAIEHFLTP